ncbi:MAG: PD-(D/E)XK motif protein [Alphaproteobacteria bacterium]|nr:PD-(D/E)XK motif protein [Alphaproteobacteria bacterium]
MTSSRAPWDEMKTPGSDYTVRYVTAPGDVTLCWGKDAQGHCLFIVQLEGDHTEQFRKNATTVNGIEVDLRQLPEPGKQGLILTLEKHVDRDLFLGLCQTLIGNLDGISDPAAALAVALNHIQRWKAFLAGKRTRVLSAEEVRGLFSELCFLRLLKDKHLSDAQAVEAWCGPDRVHQDFIFGDTAVEVKSISGRDRSIVRVSSEDQLETVSEHLFLNVYHLTEAPEGTPSQSLNKLVSVVGHELSDAEAIEDYWRKLATYGYVEMREYDTPRFLVNSSNAYRVADDFPRLVRSELAVGVVDVKYSLQLENISKFECSQNEILAS